MDNEIKLPVGLRMRGENLFSCRLRSALEFIGAPDTEKIAQLQADIDKAESLDELRPGESDMLPLKFRALSKNYLGESGFFLDFSEGDVLKDSVALMIPKSKGGERRNFLKFVKDHNRDIDAVVGRVNGAEWSESDAGLSAPGINADVLMDWKLSPRTARQLLHKPPLIESVSVMIEFEIRKSHPDLESWEFFDLLGHEVDGEEVRFIVTDILGYGHLGLVDEGADEEADRLSMLSVQNEDFKLQTEKGRKTFNKNGEHNMKVLELQQIHCEILAKTLGLQDVTEPDALIAAVNKQRDTLVKSEAENERLKIKETAFDELLTQRRDEVKNLIAKVEGEEGGFLEKAVDKMDWEELSAMADKYEKQLDAKFSPTCQKCGSTSIQRRSSVEEGAENPEQLEGAGFEDMSSYRSGRS